MGTPYFLSEWRDLNSRPLDHLVASLAGAVIHDFVFEPLALVEAFFFISFVEALQFLDVAANGMDTGRHAVLIL